MRRISLLGCSVLVGLLIATSATTAMAAGPYVGASGGIAIIHDSDVDVTGVGTGTMNYNLGGGFNIAGGYNFDPVRVELEFGYKTANIDKISGAGGNVTMPNSDINVKSYMVNSYYDFKTGNAFTPFVGVGFGILNDEINIQGSKEDDTLFGYQFTVGAGFKITPKVNIDVAYRYQGATSDFSKDGVSISYGSSNILAGVRYNF